MQKTELATKFLSAIRTGDWVLLKSILTQDVVWSIPGSSLISGEAIGPEGIVRRARIIGSYGITFTLKHLLVGRDGVALSLHNTARRGELIFDEHLATVLSVAGGKVHAIATYIADVPMVNAFFARQ